MKKDNDSGSSLSTFDTCNNKYKLKYIERLEPAGYSSALGFGTLVHAFLEEKQGKVASAGAKARGDLHTRHPEAVSQIDLDYELAMAVAGLHHVYWNKYDGDLSNKKLKFLETETEWSFSAGMRDHVGKRDGYVAHASDKAYLYEAKTATLRDRELYIALLDTNPQITSNILALKKEKKRVDGVLYDIIWKPQIRLKKNETDRELNERRIKLYESEPTKYFERKLIFRNNDNDLIEYEKELKNRMSVVSDFESSNLWYRTPSACRNQYGKVCEFYEVCWSGNPDAKSVFKTRTVKHPELIKANEGEK